MQPAHPTSRQRPKCKEEPTITAVPTPICSVYMSNTTPATTTPYNAPWVWLNLLAGAAFCSVGDGFAEVWPVAAGSGLTKLVVVTTTTPPLSMVEVKVDVTGLGEGVGDVKVGFPVVGFDGPGELVSTAARVTSARNSNRSSHIDTGRR